MKKRHVNLLKELLEAAAFEGLSRVPKWKLMQWYGQTNFTVAIRRDLRERWASLLIDELEWFEAEAEGMPLLRLAEFNGDIVLMRSDGFLLDDE